MTVAKKETGTVSDGWAPRLRREAALKETDLRLSAEPQALAPRFDRARLLTELGRTEEAKRAYLDLLALSSDHFGALNNLGALLHSTGFKTAARTCYAEAVAKHPDNPAGHVNFANALLENDEWNLARAHYEKALRLVPDHAEAHQGLARLLREMGEEDAADLHRRAGFQNRAVTVLPYRGRGQPIPVLLLVSAMGGNVPVRSFLDDHIFLVTVIVAEFYDPATPLPPHWLIVNSIGDADLSKPALEAAARLTALTTAPVVNSPAAVLATGRAANARRLGQIPGVIAPALIELPRAALGVPDALDRLAARGFAFPFLLRTSGFHNGQHFFRIENAGDLAAAHDALPGRDVTAIQFLDARGTDGKICKYRVMMIRGAIYPLHAAVAHQWKIHFVTADMADHPEHRAEDAVFLHDMPAVLGPRAMRALEHIRDVLGLDYAGVDFSVNAEGEILLFEANATMIVCPPEPDEKWGLPPRAGREHPCRHTRHAGQPFFTGIVTNRERTPRIMRAIFTTCFRFFFHPAICGPQSLRSLI